MKRACKIFMPWSIRKASEFNPIWQKTNKFKSMKYWLVIVLIAVSISCDEIFVDDITDDSIELISPVDGAKVNSNRIEFSWSTLTGADEFRFQLIASSFTSEAPVLIDTIVQKNWLELTIPAAEYQWRVRGINESYRSLYSVRTFTVTVNN